MKPAPFAYAKARSVEHAVELLTAGPDARLLAGGQSLVPALNMRLSTPATVIDLNGIGSLAGITVGDGTVEIGALTRHAEAECSSDVARHAPLIASAIPHIGHVSIRNRGTIGGSIALADPAAELPACLLALDGEAVITGPQGRRTVKADDFFKGLFETALGPQDVLTAVRVPAASQDGRFGFAEFTRRHGDYALVGLAAAARVGGKGYADLRLAYFGVASTPVRARKAEAALMSGGIDEAVAALASDLEPSDDVQATAATRRHLAGVLLRRVAAQLAEDRR